MEPIVIAIAKALEGVEYDPEFGAECPWCGERLKVTRTMPRLKNRIRYHRCENLSCPLHVLADLPGIAIKSTEPPRQAARP